MTTSHPLMLRRANAARLWGIFRVYTLKVIDGREYDRQNKTSRGNRNGKTAPITEEVPLNETVRRKR